MPLSYCIQSSSSSPLVVHPSQPPFFLLFFFHCVFVFVFYGAPRGAADAAAPRIALLLRPWTLTSRQNRPPLSLELERLSGDPTLTEVAIMYLPRHHTTTAAPLTPQNFTRSCFAVRSFLSNIEAGLCQKSSKKGHFFSVDTRACLSARPVLFLLVYV